MSHFTVLVIGDDPEKQLAPYEEGLEVPQYVAYTKEQLIQKGKDRIENYKNGMYKEYLSNPEKYKARCADNKGHIEYIENEFPKKLTWTDEEIYQEEIDGYEPNEIGPNGEILSTSNPKSKWDWFQLGGRWTGFLKLKDASLPHTVGEPGIMTSEAEEGYCDQAYIRDIDFYEMRNQEGKRAQDLYEKAFAIIGHLPINETWEEVRNKIAISDEARDIFWSQARCAAWREAQKIGRDKWPFGFMSSPDDFLFTKEEYIENARRQAITTHAVVKDGKWYERGEMGWFACVSNEKEGNQWEEEFNKLIDGLSPDTLISIYDCHI